MSKQPFAILSASLIATLCAPLQSTAVTLPLNDVSVTGGATTELTVALPAGAEFIRVTGDWSATSGSPKSDELALTVVGPGEVTAYIPVFSNGSSSSSSVPGLTGLAPLTSIGGAGDYTLTFANDSASSIVTFDNGTIELLTLAESMNDSGAISSASPSFERPEENGSASGKTTRYSSYQFTPTLTGNYIIDSQQAFDGFIVLYSGAQTVAPFSNFIAANDDSAAGESFSRLEVSLVAGQSYTLVTTSFNTIASGNFTNRIRTFDGLVLGETKATTYLAYSEQRAFIGGPEEDDSGNGLSNLLEYALGRNEASPYAPPLEIRFEGNSLIGRFYRDPDLTDIDYVLFATSDLTTPLESWEVLYDSSVDLQPNADGDFQEITDSLPVSGSRFLRLSVTFADNDPVTYAAYASDFGLTGPEDDDNENGLSNLLEYALGREPDTPYAPPLEIRFEGNSLISRFYRDPDLTDIDYVLLATSDLTTPLESWEVLYDSSVDLQPNADGDFQEVEDSQTLSGQRFFLLQIRQL